jgi:hypothetical protein
MEAVFFKKEWFKVSEYPSNIIPADAKEKYTTVFGLRLKQ